jgi:AhpD family alkylhydroperoxidase
MDRYTQFQDFRTRMNTRIIGEDHERGSHTAGGPARAGASMVMKRFFRLDGQTYEAGALDVKTKELLGLVASAVLRCDDCIAYHIDQCVKQGCSDQEIFECLDVSLIVGGSIVIPHLRRGIEFLDLARSHQQKH